MARHATVENKTSPNVRAVYMAAAVIHNTEVTKASVSSSFRMPLLPAASGLPRRKFLPPRSFILPLYI